MSARVETQEMVAPGPLNDLLTGVRPAGRGRFASAERGISFDRSRPVGDAIATALAQLRVAIQTARTTDHSGRYKTSASTQPVLFLFITSLTGSVASALGVLVGAATVLFGLASWRLRHTRLNRRGTT